MDDVLLDVPAAAALVGSTAYNIYHAIRVKKLKAKRKPSIVIRLSDLQAWHARRNPRVGRPRAVRPGVVQAAQLQPQPTGA
jgi:hypothetical protein